MIVLLAVKPGPLRDGLDALLYATPDVQLVAHANDTDAAIAFCQQHPTKLVILEVRLGDRDLLAIVPQMKALDPQGQVIALIHDEGDRKPVEKSGVDVVLTTGMRAVKLKEKITEMVVTLSKDEEQSNKSA
jgi:DNA-binding NarL/FixJ family response regulator